MNHYPERRLYSRLTQITRPPKVIYRQEGMPGGVDLDLKLPSKVHLTDSLFSV